MLSLFGLFMAIAYEAPWWVWLLGAGALVLDFFRHEARIQRAIYHHWIR